MSTLGSIGIRVENGPPGQSIASANAVPILHEIRHALEQLQRTGNTSTIDLQALPFGPGDRDRLFQALGTGEVNATVTSLGETRIRETSYPGVWIVEYLSPNGAELTAHIEVTQVPTLLATPHEEIDNSLQRLDSLLTTDPFSPSEERQE